jgi:hypothetical protein
MTLIGSDASPASTPSQTPLSDGGHALADLAESPLQGVTEAVVGSPGTGHLRPPR